MKNIYNNSRDLMINDIYVFQIQKPYFQSFKTSMITLYKNEAQQSCK